MSYAANGQPYRIYLAGPWKYRHLVREDREILRRAGMTVDCQWLDAPDGDAPEYLRQEAQRDVEDIRNADALVVMNYEKSEGKAFETGMAVERGMPVIIVGPAFNVFAYLPEVILVPTLRDAIPMLQGFKHRRAV